MAVSDRCEQVAQEPSTCSAELEEHSLEYRGSRRHLFESWRVVKDRAPHRPREPPGPKEPPPRHEL